MSPQPGPNPEDLDEDWEIQWQEKVDNITYDEDYFKSAQQLRDII